MGLLPAAPSVVLGADRLRAAHRRAHPAPLHSNSLRSANYLALGVNGFFVLLHLVQSHLWYDGLAQDVSIWSSLGSIVVMLVWVLLMENPRRGLFFGKKIGFLRRLTEVARRYHGYYFAWAIVYTFWYHPMEATSGHLIGFLYLFLLMVQGSLFLTRAHVNRWWTLVLEVAVLAHGTLVAIMQGEGMWPMFAFGFGGIFVITQMHGLSWPRRVRGLVLATYCAGVLAVYGPLGWSRLSEVLRVPLIDYAAVFAPQPDRRERRGPGPLGNRSARHLRSARRRPAAGGKGTARTAQAEACRR